MPAVEVVVVPDAERQIRAIDRWWRENRSAAAALFTEELAAALELIAGAPRIGRRRRHRGVPGMRRILLRATRYHLYYAPSDDGRRLFVLAVWSALRGKAPPLRSPC
jgi:plasmid stabilization system protein ParE